MKSKLIVALAAGSLLALAGTAAAFHDGGVAACEGCHTMHNSLEGAAVPNNKHDSTAPQYDAHGSLLKGADGSSTCLGCHGRTTQGSYRVFTVGTMDPATVPANYTPGGDFAWLNKSFTWDAHGSTKTEAGERHGHNIVAADFGLVADDTLTTAPGGSYAASDLGCHSCHDPHGKYRIMGDGSVATTGLPIAEAGSYGASPEQVDNGDGTFTTTAAVGVYRLLGGIGYEPKSSPGKAFTNTVPVAVSPGSYNRTENEHDTRVAYGEGMSEWCQNCHAGIHRGAGSHQHPTGASALLGTAIAGTYNVYVKSGDLNGTSADSYSSLVPYEEGTADRAVLTARAGMTTHDPDGVSRSGDEYTTQDDTTGPDGTANVMCLSCHRAHASGYASMTRWDNSDAMFVTGGAYESMTDDANGRKDIDHQAALYGRDASHFATYQRSLCNKCHAKD